MFQNFQQLIHFWSPPRRLHRILGPHQECVLRSRISTLHILVFIGDLKQDELGLAEIYRTGDTDLDLDLDLGLVET